MLNLQTKVRKPSADAAVDDKAVQVDSNQFLPVVTEVEAPQIDSGVTSEAAAINKKETVTKRSSKPYKQQKQLPKTFPNTTREPGRDCEENQLPLGRQLRTRRNKPARYLDFDLS